MDCVYKNLEAIPGRSNFFSLDSFLYWSRCPRWRSSHVCTSRRRNFVSNARRTVRFGEPLSVWRPRRHPHPNASPGQNQNIAVAVSCLLPNRDSFAGPERPEFSTREEEHGARRKQRIA